jgi:hypothetical protein
MEVKNTLDTIQKEIKNTITYNIWLYKKFHESILKEEWDLLYKIYLEYLDFIHNSLKNNIGLKFIFLKTIEKNISGSIYPLLVYLRGSELFGSAKYPNEIILKENEFFRLTFIPAKNSSNLSLFHVGGILPYSDKIFRFLPEINFFNYFIENGISVYAMELKGNKFQIPNYNSLTLNKILNSIEDFSEVAYNHNQNKKMILEGYCGLGIQSLSYIMLYPEQAEKKFSLATLFVSPIDGATCGTLSNAMDEIPNYLIDLTFFLSNIVGELPFTSTQFVQDLSFNSLISKTPLGLFYSGWKKEKYQINDLWNKDSTLEQKKDIAGTYWISPLNGYLYPVPLDLAKFYTRLFKQGINNDGILPWKIQNQNLDIKTILEKTTLKIIGFYGEQDRLVPSTTANILKNILQERYIHVIHSNAGHISYVLTPESWIKNNKKSLSPNPIDLIKNELL